MPLRVASGHTGPTVLTVRAILPTLKSKLKSNVWQGFCFLLREKINIAVIDAHWLAVIDAHWLAVIDAHWLAVTSFALVSEPWMDPILSRILQSKILINVLPDVTD